MPFWYNEVMKYQDYPFKEHKSIKLSAVLFALAGISCLTGSVFVFLAKEFSGSRAAQIVVGILLILFGLFFILDCIHTILKRTVIDDNGIQEYGIFGRKSIEFDKDCNVHIEETTTNISMMLTLEISKEDTTIAYSYKVSDYTLDDCSFFYETILPPMKEKGCRMEYSPLLKKMNSVFEKKKQVSSNEALFEDFKPESKEDVIRKRKKKLSSMVIVFAVLEAMAIFLLVLSILRPILDQEKGESFTTNDIIFIILYSLMALFILIYMFLQIHRLNHKKDDDFR